VAVSESDVRHVASLARLTIDPSRLSSLVQELNGILAHMDVLERVEAKSEMGDVRPDAKSTPLRSDHGGASVPLATKREAFAPLMKDGFFLVPRLATHEDQGERAP
jgi:aspartyl-tRNA(Asn)/glutamyl-tRNA(Gln) amidotransferase subunit C